ncbi:hypothetical protein V6N13_032117 [Hibiscus sabdariffa]
MAKRMQIDELTTEGLGRDILLSKKSAIGITQPRGPKQRPTSRCKRSRPEGLHKWRRTSKKGKRLAPQAATHDAPAMPRHARHRVANIRSSSRHTTEHVEKKREYESTKIGDKKPYFNSEERVGREGGAMAERMKERVVEKEERISERIRAPVAPLEF